MADQPELDGCMPKLTEGEDLMIGGEADSTNWYCATVGQINLHQIHRHHITEPIGLPLIKFRSKAKFLSAIIQVIEGMFLPLLVDHQLIALMTWLQSLSFSLLS
jgi:hypothetical protein